VGEKVADCVLLFGFHRLEAFPVDVWLLRVMRRLFFRNRKVSEERIHHFAQKRWGSVAGYVQQYIYHAARTGLL
jgi:N-glycosylase/DNA lyase